MIADMIHIFRHTTSAAKQKFFRKSEIETSASHKVSFKKLICHSSLSKIRYLVAQCLRSFNSKQRKNEQVPAKMRPGLTVSTR